MNQHYQGPAHIAIHTADLDESIAFYEKIGGHLRQQDTLPAPAGRSAWLWWSSAASCWN